MTRRSRARWLAFATAILVVAFAAVFAWLRNLGPTEPVAAAGCRVPARVDRADPGRAVFASAGKAGGHAALPRPGPAGGPTAGGVIDPNREA